ncbi:transposase family protein [Scytonema sp. NUACC26]|uniref:transposase family protein n=1 Tax=Scytonema sp. NUACC26 TaxID=3140176 RepID=UPI0034DBCD89
MSDVLDYIKSNPQETQRLVGLKYEQLEQLISEAIALHNKKQQDIEASKVRIINKGGGRKVKLPIEEQILLTLIYLRHFTTFQLLGIQFGVSESTANDTFNYWFPVLQELLPSSLIEQVKKNASDYEIVQEVLTEYELIVDSCEQARERPGEYKEQKKYYSGKKKNHTFKNQIIVLPEGQDIVDVIAGEPGPKSDITLFRSSNNGFNPHQKFKGDKGYEGEPSINTSMKKPRSSPDRVLYPEDFAKKGELTPSQKEQNKELASERIFVEHLIRVIKIFRIASERFRLN